MDAKLQEILLDYGLEGYGLYWYCLELIAGNVDGDNLTFELEHDCRIIARNTGSSAQKVTEMMGRFVELGLFENTDGIVTCLKLAKKSDDYTAKVVRSRKPQAIDSKGILVTPTKTEKDPLEEKKIEQNKTEESKLNNNKEEKEENTNTTSSLPAVATKPKFEADDLRFAEKMFERLLINNLNHKKPNLDNWAVDIRKARTLDKRSLHALWVAFDWASKDGFWCENILSPKKLREHFDKLTIKANKQSIAEQPRNLSPYGGNW